VIDKVYLPALFFDRDGVINIDTGYVYQREIFVWVDGAIDAIRVAKKAGYLVFVVTNQSGVARGYFTEQHVKDLHEWMNQTLRQHGTLIDQFYYCPHHPDGILYEYAISCNCRKPLPGMILRAVTEWQVDTGRSFLVGDKESDMEAAVNAGIRGLLFRGSDLYSFIVDNLRA